jgi:uncharacterized protein YfaS (alpha-2-macroglobulin family)
MTILASLTFAFAFAGGDTPISEAPNNAPKEVNFSVERNVAPSPKIRFFVNTKNARQIPIQIYKLPSEDLIHIFDGQMPRPHPTGRPVMSFLLDVAQKKASLTAPQDSYFERQFNLPNISPGYYLMQAPGYGGTSWTTFNVTNLSILVKRGEKRSLTWVTEAKSGHVVSGASVTAFRKLSKIASTTTDDKGIANLNITPGEEIVLVKSGRDLAAINSSGSSRDGTIVSHMQFDRPVYRPGQKGEFKSILRKIKGPDYEPIANQTVTEEVLDPQSTLIERHELKTTAIGTVAGSFDIPSEGALGFYTVQIRKGNETLSLQNFQVAEYRKPAFKATSAFSQKRYLTGEKVQIRLSTEYYFGAKVPGAQVQMTVRRSPMSWGGDGYEYSDGNLYSRNTYQADQVVAQDILSTGKDGTVTIEIPTMSDAPDSNYNFSFTITDGSSRQITHSNSVAVYAAAIRVAVHATVGYVPLGRLVPIEVQLTDLDGAPVGGKVDVELRHQVWSEKEKRNVEQTLEKTTVTVPKLGKAKVSMPAKAQGYMSIVAIAKDSGGRKTTSRSDVYVADPFSSPENQKAPPGVGVRLEKRQYTLGETVNGFVESNRPGHPILLTMEGSDLLNYVVLAKPGPFTFKLEKAACPNMDFDVNQWVEGNRTFGGAQINVIDPTRRLTVELKPERTELAPGDKAKYTVTTKDSTGKPIAAEVGLQVIDEAIYAVQPDNTPSLVGTFWGSRPNGVTTTASAPLEMSGGAYQQQKNLGKDAPMRTQFVDTAYWNSFVETGANGESTVEFDMPGNLTAWRAQARAITGLTQVGEAQAMTKSSRPLTLRLATPRQMVVGDQLSLVGTVTNRNLQAENVRVKVQVGDVDHEETVKAPASGDAKVLIPIEAKEIGTMKIKGEIFDSAGTRVDGLEMGVIVNPNGIPFREVKSGTIGSGTLKFSLLENRILGSERVKVRFYGGPGPLIGGLESSLLDVGRYTPIIAAEQVETAARLGLPWMDERIREPIAMLGRTHQASGWGWWDQGTPDPVITARVLRGLAVTQNYPEWATLRTSAREAAEHQYASVQFAEYRAHLVEALAIAGSDKAAGWAQEVDETKTPISPTAQLALAHALLLTEKNEQARARVDRLTALVSKGTTTFLPVGQGVGWTGSELEANARLLELTAELHPGSQILDSLAEWVIDHASNYMGPGDSGAVIRALHRYVTVKPSADKVGDLKITADGVNIPVRRQPDGLWAEATLPAASAGKPVSIQGIDPNKPLRYVIESNAFRKADAESNVGVRTLFRWEVMNEAGAWEELNRPVRRNEPVRASAVVWGDSVTDAVKVVLPIPAGFEFVDQDRLGNARNEVRDGAVIYYTILSNGLPATFRFYLRAETDGKISVPAAMTEALRRPESRGNSDALHIIVAGG